ncbi:MAG: sugar ABC transporter ATP-binding protein [Acidobacteriota bacterium]
MQPILEMRMITKRFPGVLALDKVDLSVSRGEVVALAGENGAGKSTLMKVLGGIYQPETGEILIDGAVSAIRSVSEGTAKGIAFVHQELNVLDNLSVAENVFLGREPLSLGFLVDRKRMNDDAQIYLDRLGLDVHPQTNLGSLSLARRQMVEIAKALSINARILILDEPTSSLTLDETGHLLKVVDDLRSQGIGVLYISHRLTEINEIADRVVVLRDGKNAGEIPRDEIGHDRIVKLMVGRDIERSVRSAAASDRQPFAEIRNLRTSRYPDRPVSFDVRKGEVLGFAGLVGAGRSEAAQAIFGVDACTSCDISLDGKPVSIASVRNAIANGIYLVPEDRRTAGLFVDNSIRENITLPDLASHSAYGFVNTGDEGKTAREMCQKLNVKAPSVETKAANLSGGNQQKVVLAKWLSLKPRLLILDEPTRGIDVGAKAEIYQLIRDLAERGVAIIMISSDMEEILAQSDRIVVMHEGRITGTVSGADAAEETIMRLAVGLK